MDVGERGGGIATSISVSGTPGAVTCVVLHWGLVNEYHVSKWGGGEEFGVGPLVILEVSFGILISISFLLGG